MAVHPSVLDLIGDTPIVDVSELSPNPSVRLLAKMEGQNPAGSGKDRIALARAAAPKPTAPWCPAAPSSSRLPGTPVSPWP